MRYGLEVTVVQLPKEICLQVLKPGKSAVQLVSYQQLCWRGPVFEAEAQNNEPHIPKKYSIQTHKHGLKCQKIPHKKKETFSGPGKFVAGWSTPKLLSTIMQYVWILWKIPWRKVNLITRPFLAVLTVYGMYFFKIKQASSQLCQKRKGSLWQNNFAYNWKSYLGQIMCLKVKMSNQREVTL